MKLYKIENTVVRVLGIGIALLGVLFSVSALITMENSWRAGIDRQQKTTLVAHGIYRFSRNFVGFDLLYIGISLTYSNLINIGVALSVHQTLFFVLLAMLGAIKLTCTIKQICPLGRSVFCSTGKKIPILHFFFMFS